jgi:steroid 5-alpha reductase family enzyme
MNFLAIWTAAGAIILGLMIVLWMVSLWVRDSSIVDSFWGTGFVVATWFYLTQTLGGAEPRRWLTATLVTIWGLRLSIYILRRNWGKGEDQRYSRWREEAGAAWWWRSFFKVFLLQGILLWVISIPLLAAQVSPSPARLTVVDVLGGLLWLIGFVFEAVGDAQLTRFRADPANQGKVLNRGLWRYTRHPNYFGEAAMWWGYYLVAATAGGWWTIFSPILMTFLLLQVSGVAMLERSLKQAKPQYRDYIDSTSAFIPWFPRRRPN